MWGAGSGGVATLYPRLISIEPPARTLRGVGCELRRQRGDWHRRRPPPGSYIRTVPVGYRRIVYGGYSCYYVGGVYYRTVIYGGDAVYVIVH